MENSNLMALNISNKIIEGNFPNLGKELHIQVSEAHRIPTDRNWK